MRLHALKKPEGLRSKKIIGRGAGSGHGRTSTKGHKGQRSRAGRSVRRGFEGGQMPLVRRLPKRGFFNIFRTEVAEVNIRYLEKLAAGTTVDIAKLTEMGLCKGTEACVKIIGRIELKNPLTVIVHKFTKGAKESIEKSGGKAEELKLD